MVKWRFRRKASLDPSVVHQSHWLKLGAAHFWSGFADFAAQHQMRPFPMSVCNRRRKKSARNYLHILKKARKILPIPVST